jgi:hypothetical protein
MLTPLLLGLSLAVMALAAEQLRILDRFGSAFG